MQRADDRICNLLVCSTNHCRCYDYVHKMVASHHSARGKADENGQERKSRVKENFKKEKSNSLVYKARLQSEENLQSCLKCRLWKGSSKKGLPECVGRSRQACGDGIIAP